MGVVSEVTRMARGWLAVSNPGYESIISMMITTKYYFQINSIVVRWRRVVYVACASGDGT